MILNSSSASHKSTGNTILVKRQNSLLESFQKINSDFIMRVRSGYSRVGSCGGHLLILGNNWKFPIFNKKIAVFMVQRQYTLLEVV